MNAIARTAKTALVTILTGGVFLGRIAGAPLGTAFSYQGQLNDGGQPGNGRYDLQFSLYAVATGGTPVGLSALREGVAVKDGLFTTLVDFGTDVFQGDEYWLELAV